jgi:hypothetical protein
MTVARLSIGAAASDFLLPLAAPFNPCGNSSEAAGTTGIIRLPPAIVAAQPPPTFSIGAALLAALSGAGGPLAGLAAVDVQMVQ